MIARGDGVCAETQAVGWAPVDALPEVVAGLVGRDAVYDAIRAGRIRCAKISARRYLVPLNWLEELAAAGR